MTIFELGKSSGEYAASPEYRGQANPKTTKANAEILVGMKGEKQADYWRGWLKGYDEKKHQLSNLATAS